MTFYEAINIRATRWSIIKYSPFKQGIKWIAKILYPLIATVGNSIMKKLILTLIAILLISGFSWAKAPSRSWNLQNIDVTCLDLGRNVANCYIISSSDKEAYVIDPGGVCFYFKKSNVLFTGNTLFKDGIGRTDLDGGSYLELQASLEKLAKLPPTTVVFPGHGNETLLHKELSSKDQ